MSWTVSSAVLSISGCGSADHRYKCNCSSTAEAPFETGLEMTNFKRQDNGSPTSAAETTSPSSSFPSATSLTDASTETGLSDSASSTTSSSFITSSITIASTDAVSQSTSPSMSTTFVTISQAPSMTTATATVYAPRPSNPSPNFQGPPIGDSLPPPSGFRTGQILQYVSGIGGGVAFLFSLGVLVWCLCWGPRSKRRKRRDTVTNDDEAPKSPPKMAISAPLVKMIPGRPNVPYPPPLATVSGTGNRPNLKSPSPSLSELVPGSSWSYDRPPPPTPPQVSRAKSTNQGPRQPKPVPLVSSRPPPQQIPTQWAAVPQTQKTNLKRHLSSFYNIYSPATPPYTPESYYARQSAYPQPLNGQNPVLRESRADSGWGSSGGWSDVEILTGEQRRNKEGMTETRASSGILPF